MSQQDGNANSQPDGVGELPSSEFVQLFTKSQRKIFLSILAQVPHPVDAEEILQETNVVIWRKSGQFQLGTNFHAWACQIARYEILKFRERRRNRRIVFSDEFVNYIADEAVIDADEWEQRRLALMDCLRKLKDRDRDLIRHRYGEGKSGKALANQFGRPVNSIYQSLGRIRRTLLECIQRRLAAEVH